MQRSPSLLGALARSRHAFHIVLLVALTALGLLPLACAPSSATDSSDGTGSHSKGTGTSAGGNGGGCNGFCNQGGGNSGPLVIDPPTSTITVVDGVASPIDLNATMNGVPVDPATWEVDLSAVAGIDATGLVTA